MGTQQVYIIPRNFIEISRGVDVFSFGYNRNSEMENYTTSYELISCLIRTVSYGGNLLLDVGPKDYGRIPIVMEERLRDIGTWLNINGEAIFSTRIWNIQNEMDNATYYTSTNSSLYAITTVWPNDNMLVLTYPIPTQNTVITMLGYDKQLNFKYTPGKGILVQFPYIPPPQMPSSFAWVKNSTVSKFNLFLGIGIDEYSSYGSYITCSKLLES